MQRPMSAWQLPPRAAAVTTSPTSANTYQISRARGTATHLFSLYIRAASELAGELGLGSDSRLCKSDPACKQLAGWHGLHAIMQEENPMHASSWQHDAAMVLEGTFYGALPVSKSKLQPRRRLGSTGFAGCQDRSRRRHKLQHARRALQRVLMYMSFYSLRAMLGCKTIQLPLHVDTLVVLWRRSRVAGLLSWPPENETRTTHCLDETC